MAEVDDQRRGRALARRAPVLRRARDRVPPRLPVPASLPSLDALHAPDGRAALEAMVRRRGARAAAVVRDLAAGWRRGDGGPPGDADLRLLLESHGLARSFARRERAAALHALRAAGGVKARAAEALEVDVAGLDEILARTGAAGEAEAIREERRAALRRRGTLAERARLVLDDATRVRDLGLLGEFEADLRSRLPGHVAALRSSGTGPLDAALARSLALPRAAARALAGRLGVDVAGAAPHRRERSGRARRRGGGSRPRE
jgi:hypothetical protein